MKVGISKFTNEDRQIMGSMITKAKAERQLSNQDIANITGFGASSVGRASRADNNTTDKVYINVLRALGLSYTPGKKTKKETNIEALKKIRDGLDYGWGEVELALEKVRDAEANLKNAEGLFNEAYEKLEKLMEEYGKAL